MKKRNGHIRPFIYPRIRSSQPPYCFILASGSLEDLAVLISPSSDHFPAQSQWFYRCSVCLYSPLFFCPIGENFIKTSGGDFSGCILCQDKPTKTHEIYQLPQCIPSIYLLFGDVPSLKSRTACRMINFHAFFAPFPRTALQTAHRCLSSLFLPQCFCLAAESLSVQLKVPILISSVWKLKIPFKGIRDMTSYRTTNPAVDKVPQSPMPELPLVDRNLSASESTHTEPHISFGTALTHEPLNHFPPFTLFYIFYVVQTPVQFSSAFPSPSGPALQVWFRPVG